MKRIKDPIYGYIEIDRAIVRDIIDSPYFQRLRNIRQTSYTPLYPSSYHNRYVHSLGVYFLGKMAFNAIKSQLDKLVENKEVNINLQKIQELFELACLLHDIGHAPFSHTGESLYTGLDAGNQLYNQLKNAVNNEIFAADLEKKLKGKEPAPHETMSCIVALHQFPKYLRTAEDRSLFSRCIIGLPYQADSSDKLKILNCIIGLLNSSIIDVDRLDYIIRDAETMGFKSVSIDYERLLGGLQITDNDIQIGYEKNALSVIENAIYAHDVEKKWVQNHSAIQYEVYLLKYAMSYLNSSFGNSQDTNPIFCYESLTEEGKKLVLGGESIHISLLADEDILHLIKRLHFSNEFIREIFSRNKRRRPLWKSEAEYIALFEMKIGETSTAIKSLYESISRLEKYCREEIGCPVINQDALDYLNQELMNLEETSDIKDEEKATRKAGLLDIQRWMKSLKNVVEQRVMPFDFLIVPAQKFSSNFEKDTIGKIPIYFPELGETHAIETVSTILKANPTMNNKFFYIFYREPVDTDEKVTDYSKPDFIQNIAKALYTLAVT